MSYLCLLNVIMRIVNAYNLKNKNNELEKIKVHLISETNPSAAHSRRS